MSGHTPAYPVPLNPGETYKGHSPCDGLTKRELFAAMAMQGLLASIEDGKWEEFAAASVAQADALLAELAKDGSR